MRMRMIGALVLGVAAAALVAQSGVLAQPAPADVVKARQDLMKSLFPTYYRGFVQVARGESTDIASIPQKAQQAAAEVRRFVTLFPPGTEAGKVPNARAKPEIWSQQAEFRAAADKLATETERLGEIARGGDLNAVKAQVANVTQACGGCHGGPPKSGGKFRTEAE